MLLSLFDMLHLPRRIGRIDHRRPEVGEIVLRVTTSDGYTVFVTTEHEYYLRNESEAFHDARMMLLDDPRSLIQVTAGLGSTW
jgi:hypothetical protein